MISDENLFEINEARGSKEGIKRGSYNKEKSKSKEDLYDELQDKLEKEFYFPGVAKGGDLKVNLIMKDENKAELKGKRPARLIASSMSKYRDIKDEKELDTAKRIAKEMGFKTELDKTKKVPTLIIKLEESLNEKKSNRLTYHEFVDYLDSINNGYTGFAKVTGNKGSGYRYTLSNKLTREQHDYLAQYDNVDFGTSQYKYAPEIKKDTVILLDRMSKTSPMKEDYDEDFSVDDWGSNESSDESIDRASIESDFENITNMSDARERLKKYKIDLIKKDNRNYILRKDGKGYTFYVLDNPNEVRKDLVKAVYKLTSSKRDSSITESKGVIRKYKGYTLHDTGDSITITDPHGKTVGTERTEIGAEGLVDDLVNDKNMKENIGSDIAEYQKWVDYDMKKYGRISSLTNHKVRKAGLRTVKDRYGDYEVIANEPIKEDLEREFTIHYNREGFEFGGYGAVRVKATNEDEALKKFYAEKKDDKITISSIRPTENEDIRKGIRLLETKKVNEDISMSSVSPEKSKINFNVTDSGDFTFTINGKEYKGHTDKPEDMSKDLKDFGFSLTEDVEVVDKNQEKVDKKAGLENLLNDLINDENEAINGYNSAIVNFELEGKSDLTNVFRDIIKDEQNHIGNLQKVLNEINPTTIANLEQGQQEATDTLNK